MDTIESPGSLNYFAQSHPELSPKETAATYHERLDSYRRSLAAAVGITPEELHDKGFTITNAIL